MTQESDWELHHALFRKVPLVTGESVTGLVMRRRVGGRWEYRRPTAEEEADHVSADAW